MPASPSTDDLIELIAPLITHDGYITTSLPSVTLMALRRPIPRTPLMYEPSLNIVAQGYKIGYLGDREAGSLSVRSCPNYPGHPGQNAAI